MKKAIIVLWGIFVLAILIFVIFVFNASTQTAWLVFSITMPLVAISFWGAIILTVIDFVRSQKEKQELESI